MGGFDDHVAIMGDWMPPSPSPRAFFSSMISDDIAERSIMDPVSENRSASPLPRPDGHGASVNAVMGDQTKVSVGGDEASNPYKLAEPKMSYRGGLMERIAARAGFNAPRLNTESIRPTELSKKPEVQSPCLTIPPGLSPTTLLDSPVFLTNSLVQPSPTTGKFSFLPSANNQNSTLMTEDPQVDTFDNLNASAFVFKPVAESASFHHVIATANESFTAAGVSIHSNTSLLHQSTEPAKEHLESNSALFQQSDFSKSHEGNIGGSNPLPEQTYNSIGFIEHSPPFDEQLEDVDQRSSGDPNAGSAPAEDGYNWRKYGQKHVKGSEYPRSYYKCTHPNCPVKKKVERSHEGHITEIIYKGAHNHPKPPPNRRSGVGPLNAPGEIQVDSEQPGMGGNGDRIWSAMQNGNVAGVPDWKAQNPEQTSSSALAGLEYTNGSTTVLQAQSGAQYESGDGVDGSCTFSNEEEEDRATHGSVSFGYDGEGDELESKRRRIETYAPDMTGATRAIREPRVVVQTTSDVDILDDGYRWRKYGQKVVKGNPNPRSYYKCTSPGCNVRKHVERASHDLKSVITTYEGKHNHDVPAARNTGNANSGPSTLPSQQSAAASSHIHRPEPSQIRNSTARFERPSLGSFGFPGRPQLGAGPPPAFGFGMASMGICGLGPNQGKLPPPAIPVHPPYFGHQPQRQPPVNGMGSYMLPKGQPKMEPVTDTGLNSNTSTLYQQLMSRLPPLRPHM